jgi:hypothetical protein
MRLNGGAVFSVRSVPIVALIFAPLALQASVIMYGVNGGTSPTVTPPSGDLVIVDQTTGAATPLYPSGFPRLTGLGIEPNGTMYASTLGGVLFPPRPGQHTTSDLLQLNGSGAGDIGTIRTAGGSAVTIADLAVQPGTGTLFAISNEFGDVGPGGLYSINPANGVATLVGDTGEFFGSIAFATDGTLYLIGAGFNMGPVNPVLETVNPSTGAAVGSPVPLADFYGAFGIRPTDSMLFVSNGMEGQVFTLNASTGAATLLPSTTLPSQVADFDFATPEPGSMVLAGLGLMGFLLARCLKMSRRGRPTRIGPTR